MAEEVERKRAKREETPCQEHDDPFLGHEEKEVGYVPHPLGVVSSMMVATACGGGGEDGDANAGIVPRSSLGMFGDLSDEVLLDILSQLDARALAAFSRCSRLCYVFGSTDELWKQLVFREASRSSPKGSNHHNAVRDSPADGDGPAQEIKKEHKEEKGTVWWYDQTWKRTYARLVRDGQHEERQSSQSHHESRTTPRVAHGSCSPLLTSSPPLCFGAIPSDTLFDAWLSATARIQPHWLEHDNIPRRDSAELSAQQFDEQFEQPRQPVVIRGAAASWPALQRWTRETIADELHTPQGSEQLFDAFDEYSGSHRMTMAQYLAYARQQVDERPLYVFEPRYIEENPALAAVYRTPPQFQHDLMAHLGRERPDWRWLLAGPARTGTNFHVDPNHTSAWNTVIYGSKKWVMFPPEVTPPGVSVCPETGRVEQPDSVMAWFLQHYDEIHDDPHWRRTVRECICGPGDTVFIPDGWWHLVLNTEETVAVTHNYIGPANLHRCLAFLDTGVPAHMTHAGPQDLAQRLRFVLQQREPKLLAQAEERLKCNKGSGRSVRTKPQSSINTFSFNFGQ